MAINKNARMMLLLFEAQSATVRRVEGEIIALDMKLSAINRITEALKNAGTGVPDEVTEICKEFTRERNEWVDACDEVLAMLSQLTGEVADRDAREEAAPEPEPLPKSETKKFENQQDRFVVARPATSRNTKYIGLVGTAVKIMQSALEDGNDGIAIKFDNGEVVSFSRFELEPVYDGD